MTNISNEEANNNARKIQFIIDFSTLFVNPLVAFLLLLGITHLQGNYFDKHYFIMGAMAFAFLFPGKKYIDESIGNIINIIVVRWLVFSTLILLFMYISDYIEFVDNNILLNWMISTPLMLIAVNAYGVLIVNKVYSSQKDLSNIIIVGHTPVGLKLGNYLQHNKFLGKNLIGYFDDRLIERSTETNNDLIGSFAEVAKFCNENSIGQVFVCTPLLDNPRIQKILEDLKDTTTSVYFVPDIFITDLIQSEVTHIHGIPVIALRNTPFTGINSFVNSLEKRVFDIIISLTILILFSPILIWVALRIKQTSPGPIIFVQRRYGIDGNSINVYKFRSMSVTEDGNNKYRQVEKNDSRVTPFGAFLRKTSLDEFPQFYNVLQGRMSIVGPRPHVVAVNENYRKLIPGYMLRHKVKPGITGWAQVNGFRGGDALEDMQGRIRYDLEYLRNWSIALDLLIIFRTVFVFIKGDEAAY